MTELSDFQHGAVTGVSLLACLYQMLPLYMLWMDDYLSVTHVIVAIVTVAGMAGLVYGFMRAYNVYCLWRRKNES